MKAGVEVRMRAARVVADVVSRGASLARVLPANCADLADARDVALLRTLVFGTLRAHPRLARVVQLALDRPLTRGKAELDALLCVGVHQLAHMRVAPHA